VLGGTKANAARDVEEDSSQTRSCAERETNPKIQSEAKYSRYFCVSHQFCDGSDGGERRQFEESVEGTEEERRSGAVVLLRYAPYLSTSNGDGHSS